MVALVYALKPSYLTEIFNSYIVKISTIHQVNTNYISHNYYRQLTFVDMQFIYRFFAICIKYIHNFNTANCRYSIPGHNITVSQCCKMACVSRDGVNLFSHVSVITKSACSNDQSDEHVFVTCHVMCLPHAYYVFGAFDNAADAA